MFCNSCGQQVSQDSAFCSRCGRCLSTQHLPIAERQAGCKQTSAGQVALAEGRATRKSLETGPKVWLAAAALLVLIVAVISLNTSQQSTAQQEPITQPTSAQAETTLDTGSASYQNAQRILSEQKARAEAVTQRAASILTSDAPTSGVKRLYNNRW